MGDFEAKGDEFAKKADKKLKSFSLFGSSTKYEDGAELLDKAANQYKLGKAWEKAGETYVRLSEIHKKLESEHEAASALVDAANAYRKVNSAKALECMQNAVSIFTNIGRLSMAAKHLKDMAEIYEKEDNAEDALTFYQQAADLYAGEEVNSTSNQCKLKVAQFAAQLEQYPKAVEIYEEIAKSSLDSNLLRYSVKGYLLNAGLCHLATGDIVNIRNAIDKYQELDLSFSGTRECKFLQDLADAIEEGEVQKFTEVVYQFDSMTRLDPWKTTLLLRTKQNITAKEHEEDDLT